MQFSMEVTLANNTYVSTIAPPLVTSTTVQCVNMPLVRATIVLQNPKPNVPNIRESLRQSYKSQGPWRIVAWDFCRCTKNGAQILHRYICQK